ncbi:uncharacterized protein LOC105684892 [Athalia rosae]|uniref:uncharacterized protein LOC105684892 n=1 Tax=Athalia rosae TaxID=37344 RepID=UPI00203481A7|nr:uncharacterized protein LOC105684892 [Athalia rosae]XP_020706850.2 uncharacterized protein LOC105684892 [Athalia rosae]
MSAKTLASLAEEYFYNINPLAQRIGEDVAATKDAYEGLWSTLSLAERNQAIDETIIQPEVALKYTVKKSERNRDGPDSYPKLRIQTGMKYMVDDTGSTLRWRDEHSAPFSLMTQSQMNLNIFDSCDETKCKPLTNHIGDSPHFTSPLKVQKDDIMRNDNYNLTNERTVNQIICHQTDGFTEKSYIANERDILLNSRVDKDNSESIFSKLIGKTSLLKIQNSLDSDDTECLVSQKSLLIKSCQITPQNMDKNQMNINLTSSAKSKTNEIDESTALLETPSSYSSFQSSQLQDDGIPKTGFEFLDNW